MKTLKLNDNQRLYSSRTGEDYKINNMPLSWLIHFLADYKCYTKEMTINYIKKHYNLDISDEVTRDNPEYVWSYTENIYEKYLNENPRKNYESNSRQYFQSKGRDYYLKFSNWRGDRPKKDFLFPLIHMDVVHHIHPLMYGGTNDTDNLVHISDFNHDILHMNPLEKDEKYCHQAVNYLWYLHNFFIQEKNDWLWEKYGMLNHLDKSPSFVINMYKSIIKEEMLEFYKVLQNDK